ncbi:hypothetical protein GCM10011583_13240 [Streptomyces camponoticapitis]|uniref:Uncharacterized protein n=1 Tax=Streptomyces camponoticapitis TaxID=1616125 RepID=A0ABQ2E3N3_9ACTN|nr:hypothetical protein GCM10011583_13240 [Streptomyces camponoticapitis]
MSLTGWGMKAPLTFNRGSSSEASADEHPASETSDASDAADTSTARAAVRRLAPRRTGRPPHALTGSRP